MLTILVKWEVLHLLYDSTGDAIMDKWPIWNLNAAGCAVFGNVVYVCSSILMILWKSVLRLTIHIKCDVLHALDDGIPSE